MNICLPWERAFSNKFLEECLICFKMCGDDKKYVYILWDMVFVICIGIIWDTLLDMEFKDIWEVCMGILWGMRL